MDLPRGWLGAIGRTLYRLATLWLLWTISYWLYRIAMALQESGADSPAIWYAGRP